MDLREALKVLSKSSPYAVSTAGTEITHELDSVKSYLYFETEIERTFREKLQNIANNEVVFLCGSSGDGKSEILTRCSTEFSEKADFHLDATHSFDPDLTAVETLNSVFSSFKQSSKGLVVGVNIGMLGNFAREGSSEHDEIKEAIDAFLGKYEIVGRYTFIDFESFPKFEVTEGRLSSDFFSALINKVIANTDENPFIKYMQKTMSDGSDNILITNVLFLRDSSVQSEVIRLLFAARIRKDQFITTRMLLDFIYCILTGPGYLFDNIFHSGNNEILEAISYFDPSVIRNKKLDLFMIHRTLDIKDEEYESFLSEVAERFSLIEKVSPQSMVRCLYLLKGSTFRTGYINIYGDCFNETSLATYKNLWEKHKKFDGSIESRSPLKDFYNSIVLASINKYANRNAPYLPKDQFYISSHGGYDLAAEVELSPSYKKIFDDQVNDISGFKLHLMVNGQPLDDISISPNLLDMMIRVVEGFRPNKHDKNSVVLLDKLVSKITEIANASPVLLLYKNGDMIKLRDGHDGDIQVSGL